MRKYLAITFNAEGIAMHKIALLFYKGILSVKCY